MVSKKSRAEIRAKKHRRLRNHISGTAERPRLAVFRSNNHMYAQIIDDTVGNTLVAASEYQDANCSGIVLLPFPVSVVHKLHLSYHNVNHKFS